MEELDKSLEEVVLCIKNSKDYKECIKLKEKMKSNEELIKMIEDIKLLQKKYIKSNYDSNIKKELDNLEEILNSIPIYNMYIEKLNKVNELIDYVKDDLNDYFYNLLN